MTNQVMSKQCWTRWTRTSEFQGYHIPLWGTLRAHAFENSTTKQSLQPVQCGVKADDSGSGQRRAVWIVRDGPQDAVQSMPIILEWRHRLLYMRASLKGNSGQSTFHCRNDGPPFNSSGHRYGKLPENKEYHQVHNLKKEMQKRDYKGIHDRFLRDYVFRELMSKRNRDEEVSRAWDVLAEQDHTYKNVRSRILSLQAKLVDLSKSRETIPNQWENVLTSTKRCLH